MSNSLFKRFLNLCEVITAYRPSEEMGTAVEQLNWLQGRTWLFEGNVPMPNGSYDTYEECAEFAVDFCIRHAQIEVNRLRVPKLVVAKDKHDAWRLVTFKETGFPILCEWKAKLCLVTVSTEYTYNTFIAEKSAADTYCTKDWRDCYSLNLRDWNDRTGLSKLKSLFNASGMQQLLLSHYGLG